MICLENVRFFLERERMKTKIVHWQLLKMVRLLLICLYLTSKTKANKPMVTYYINVLQHI